MIHEIFSQHLIMPPFQKLVIVSITLVDQMSDFSGNNKQCQKNIEIIVIFGLF